MHPHLLWTMSSSQRSQVISHFSAMQAQTFILLPVKFFRSLQLFQQALNICNLHIRMHTHTSCNIYIHEDTFDALNKYGKDITKLAEEGKILGYGLSEVAPYTLERAHAVHPVTAVQNEYSLWTRQPELGLIQRCASLGVAFVPFSPLARGAFGAPIPDPATFAAAEFRNRVPRFQPANWPHNRAMLQAFHDFARELGHSPASLALAWMLDRWPHVIPIPGTRSAGHLADWIGAPDITLTDADRAQIDRLLPIGWAWGDRYDDAQTALAERYS